MEMRDARKITATETGSYTSVFSAFLSTFLFSGEPCGENLYMSTAPSSWSDSIQAWYNEEKDFKYGTGATTANAVIGHYTQVEAASVYSILKK